jgi:predicted RecA/RadA family phage recombinase
MGVLDSPGALDGTDGTGITPATGAVGIRGWLSSIFKQLATTGALVTGTVASGATDSGNPVKVGGKLNTTLPTLTDGQRGDLQVGTRGSLHVELWGNNSATAFGSSALSDGLSSAGTGLYTLAQGYVYNGSTLDRVRSGGVTGMPGVSVQASPSGAYTYGHMSTATTTTHKSGAGTLRSIVVNTKGTVASTITVYDNTAGSGTVIAVIDSLNQAGTFTYDVAFATGLTLVTTGTAAPDVTVSYK